MSRLLHKHHVSWMALLLFCCVRGQAGAASIGVNFCVGQTDARLVDADETATQLVPAEGRHWNNVLVATTKGLPTVLVTNTTAGRFVALQDDSGNTNAARLTSTLTDATGYCNLSGVTPATVGGEDGMMGSYVLVSGTAETLTVSGLDASFTANGYQVYLFFDIGTVPTAARTLGYSVDDGVSSNVYWAIDSAGDNSDVNDDGAMEWLRATGLSSGSATAGANYALFEGLAGSNFTVSVTGAQRGAISGMQIVSVTASKGPVDVFLLGGQSNMLGQGAVGAIPAGEETITGLFYYVSSVLYSNVCTTGSTFGPEIGFANRMRQLRPDAQMALIKYAVGGTSLIWDWRPGSNATDTAHWGAQYSGFVTMMNKGLAALRGAGYQPRIVGMLWQQGEADSKDGWDYSKTPPVAIANEANAGALYASNLVHFVARVREQFAADVAPEGLRFVQGTILPYDGAVAALRFPARQTVNAAKMDVDEHSGSPLAVANVSSIYCDQSLTPSGSDEVHLTAAGQLMLGKLMAERMQAQDYSSWSAGLAQGMTGDDDGDGDSNGLEFFLGSDPLSSDDRPEGPTWAPAVFDAGAGLTNYFVMSFRQSLTNNAEGFSWRVEGTTNLDTWAEAAFEPVLVDRAYSTDGSVRFRYRTARPAGADRQSFMRLRLTLEGGGR